MCGATMLGAAQALGSGADWEGALDTVGVVRIQGGILTQYTVRRVDDTP